MKKPKTNFIHELLAAKELKPEHLLEFLDRAIRREEKAIRKRGDPTYKRQPELSHGRILRMMIEFASRVKYTTDGDPLPKSQICFDNLN
jgi:hypothetical protein